MDRGWARVLTVARPSTPPHTRRGWYMDKRLGAAVSTAVLLHVALLGLTVLRPHSEATRVVIARVETSATEVDVLVEEGAPRTSHSDRISSAEERAQRTVSLQGRVSEPSTVAPRTAATPDAEAELDPAGAPDSDGALAELGSGAEPEGPSDGASDARRGARPRVDLGLDGSVFRSAALEARDRTPRRRPIFSLGGSSEGVVRSVAQTLVPWEGRALLTLEWDLKGQLRSVTSSAESSRSDAWQRLVEGVRSRLAARPNAAAQGAGLRLVYLVKSELVLPESKRTLLPAAKYASAEQLRAKNLPPATVLNLGVKADDSGATNRVVSVELVRSEAP